MMVYLLFHVDHIDDAEGRDRHQQTLDGDWTCDEQAGDQVTLLGVYSTHGRADARIEQARSLPGYCDEPDCFLVDRYQVDEDKWTEGYATM